MSNPENNQQTEPLQSIEPQSEPQVQTVRSYNPFIDTVNEKPYTQMNVAASPTQLTSSIPEPQFKPNTVRANENPYNMLNDDFGGLGGAPVGQQTVNPSLNSVPDGDKKLAAEHMAKLIVDGYEQLHTFANKGLQISERKLRKLSAEGEIDLSVEIPYDYGKTITAGEFVKEFNEQNKDTLTVSKEFKKEVTPVLTRVLEKRGAGVTDEQYLIYLFGKDILVKGVIFTQIRGTMTDMLGVIKDYTAAMKESGGIPPQWAKGQNTPPPPPPPPPSSSEVYVEEVPPTDAPDFNFQYNETVMESTVQKHAVPESGKARLMAQMKRDAEIKQAIERAQDGPGKSYEEAIAKNKKGQGKRGRRPKDYIVPMDEEQIAEAIVLKERKEVDKNKIHGID